MTSHQVGASISLVLMLLGTILFTTGGYRSSGSLIFICGLAAFVFNELTRRSDE